MRRRPDRPPQTRPRQPALPFLAVPKAPLAMMGREVREQIGLTGLERVLGRRVASRGWSSPCLSGDGREAAQGVPTLAHEYSRARRGPSVHRRAPRRRSAQRRELTARRARRCAPVPNHSVPSRRALALPARCERAAPSSDRSPGTASLRRPALREACARLGRRHAGRFEGVERRAGLTFSLL